MQVAAFPRLRLEWLAPDHGLATAGALGTMADQVQHIAAEVGVMDTHTDGNDLDAMSHKRKDGTR